jgi:hypothetical protein
MEKQTVIVRDSGSSLSYDIEFRGEASDITIRYSPLINCWTSECVGKKALRLVDNGNGVTLKIKGAKLEIGYDDVERFIIALSTYHTARLKSEDYKVYTLEELV